MIFELFMTILTQCEVEDPGALWEEKKHIIAEKFFRKRRCNIETDSVEEINNCYEDCLQEIKKLLSVMTGGDKKRTNSDFDLPEPQRQPETNVAKIIMAEKMYDAQKECELADMYAATLNDDQKKVKKLFFLFLVKNLKIC